MLRRTLIGAGLLALLVGAWLLDAARPGAPAFGLGVLGVVLACGALDELLVLGGAGPRARWAGGVLGLAWLATLAAFGLGVGGVVPRAAFVLTTSSLAVAGWLAVRLGEPPSPGLGRGACRPWFALPWVGGLGCLLALLLAGRLHWVGGLVLVAKSSDIGAYFVGKTLGRHKLSPAVSPGKTVEGAVGGLVLSALVGGVVLGEVELGLPGGALVTLPGGALGAALHGLAVGAITIVSDLSESLVKRSVGVKDSGTRFGESGGFLDVADSLLLLAPLALAYTALLA